MNTYTLTQLRQGVAQYLGLGTFPVGNEKAYDASIQSAVEYCWRFTEWPFTLKKDKPLEQVNDTLDLYMPYDFDGAGWRRFKGLDEWDIKDAERYEKEHAGKPHGVYVEFDLVKNAYKVCGDVDETTTVSYQVKPPQVSTNEYVIFPQAQPIIIVAAIYQKMKEHPNSADVRQEWNMADALLTKLAYQYNMNTPNHRPRTRYEKFHTYTGDVR